MSNKLTWPLIISFIRIPMLFIGAGLTYLIFILTETPYTFPLLPGVSTLYFTAVNIVCFMIIYHVLKREGASIRDLINFQRKYIGRDIFYGVLWIFVLYFPFAVALMFTMWMLFGADMFNRFGDVFAPGGMVELPYTLSLISAMVSATLFPLLNAPIEELYYRGYAQKRLNTHAGKSYAILIPSVGFGIQHIMLAGTLTGALVYAVAFFFWGIGAAIIFQLQGRLLPLIIAHFMTNFLFGVVPLLFIMTG